MSARSAIRVVKVGGSLLDLPDLAPRLHAVLAAGEATTNVLIPGGGALADCIRRYDATFHFEGKFIHDIAIETMRITARLLAQLLHAPLVSDLTEMSDMGDIAVENDPMVVLDVESILQREPFAGGTPLTADWSVTSDSISARIATMIGAPELWLLKSVAARSSDARQLVKDGVVDPQFPVYASGLSWRVINLRDHPSQEL